MKKSEISNLIMDAVKTMEIFGGVRVTDQRNGKEVEGVGLDEEQVKAMQTAMIVITWVLDGQFEPTSAMQLIQRIMDSHISAQLDIKREQENA